MELYQIIKRPLITEKSTFLRESNRQYMFEVDLRANKKQVHHAIESLFNVNVENVRTLIVRGKIKRVGKSFGKKSNYKKAFVTLEEGSKIDFFEGV
ncbi:MAG: 50S ribosomal protein L23 [Deltaproteobacteria bacterium]|nr:50S ribosomal protein L23 [Deltaproteobacteria bacterium]